MTSFMKTMTAALLLGAAAVPAAAQQLSLIKKGFGALDIEGEVLQDPTKTGVGISRYMRTIHV